MTTKFVIAGTGFRGFCDCLALLNIPDAEIHMIDPSPRFGGIIYPRKVFGFDVDNGVQFFDSIPHDLAEILTEIMDGKVKEIDFVSESAFGGQVTEGYSLPDVSALPEEVKTSITRELKALAAAADFDREQACTNLADRFSKRFGETAGRVFQQIFQKTYLVDPAKIEPEALDHTSLIRLKYLDDDGMKALKQDPVLDRVLAARRRSLGKLNDFVSLYPDTGTAMRGWCENAVAWLQNKGVHIHQGEAIERLEKQADGRLLVGTKNRVIEADKVIWANDRADALAGLLDMHFDQASAHHRTPLILVSLLTDAAAIKDFTYLHNFDASAINYRIAASGIFSGQINEAGQSFITCECPAEIGGEAWNDPEQHALRSWQECKDLTIVAADAPLIDMDVVKIPTAFKMPYLGASDRFQQFEAALADFSPNLIFRDLKPFYRQEIYVDSLNLPALLAL